MYWKCTWKSKGYRGYYLHYGFAHGKIGCSITVKDGTGRVVAKTRMKTLHMIYTKNKFAKKIEKSY